MQTFLPFPDFAESAAVLDRQRLGKQRVETLQIVATLTGFRVRDGIVEKFEPGGWTNHPAVRMWRGYVPALVVYQLAICNEWTTMRGYRDTCMEKTYQIIRATDIDESSDVPPWLGDDAFHAAHRSKLVQKDPAYYMPLFPGVQQDLEYVWPV